MNVAALVHPNDPNDDPRPRPPRHEQEQPRPPPPQQPPQFHPPPHHSPPLDRPRDRDRERDRLPLDTPQHAQQPPPLAYRRSPPPQYASRPPSPPRHQPYNPPSDYPGPPQQQQRYLPPPSSLYPAEPYQLSHQSGRRGNAVQEVHPHPHDRLGPPAQSNQLAQAQPYPVEHRNPSLPPKSHSNHHHHHHAHTLPSTPSSGYIQPPPGRSSLHSSPPLGHRIHGSGPGSFPVVPTHVGPGISPGGHSMQAPSGPHSQSGPSGPPPPMSLRMGEPSQMYGVPHQSQGPPPPHHSHQHTHAHAGSSHSHHDRHRVRGSSTSSAGQPGPGGMFDHAHKASNPSSPVMAGLQRPPLLDERDPGPASMGGRPRGPHSGPSGPGIPPGSSISSIPHTAIGPGRSQDGVATHMLLGPGLHPGAPPKDRERERGMERSMDRERDRRGSGTSMQQESPSSAQRERDHREREREREREMQMQMERHAQREREERERAKESQREQREREREREREKERERERERERVSQREQDDFRRHAHEMMGLNNAMERDDREREWIQSQQAQALGGPPSLRVQPPPQPPMGPPSGDVWSRWVQPRTVPPNADGRVNREHERAMERRSGYEDMRVPDIEWEAEKIERPAGRATKARSNAKDREDRERAKATQKEERKSRVSANQREKERVERERAEAEMREKEREKAREREFRLHEHQLALAKEAQYEVMERERIQRERQDMEAMRARARDNQGPAQASPHHSHPHTHHHHLHSSSNQGYPPPPPLDHARPSSKQGPVSTQGMVHHPGPGDIPPQYVQERDPQFRQGSSNNAGPSSLSQVVAIPQHQSPTHLIGHHPPQHSHQMGPGPHMRQHPADVYTSGGPIGYHSRRPSPPPFHTSSVPPVATSFVFPRSTTPPPTFIRPVHHLGTFIYPRTPFPFFDFPGPIAETGAPSDPIDVRATIYVPSRFVPLTRLTRPRIWGGGLIPAVPSLTGVQRQLVQQFSGGHPGYGRPEPMEICEGRRVYTDDSDLFLCALHSGWISWSAARRARREGKDLRLDVRLTRESRYVGGLGQPLRKKSAVEPEGDGGPEDDGSALLSSGWGNSHDGSGIEILKAEFVASGTAHSFGLRNRSQRMLEYAERRCALGCVSRTGRKRRRLHALSVADVAESALQLKLDQADDDLSSTRVMVFGTDSSWPEIGFKYHPNALRDVLFPQSASDPRPSKRRKVGSSPDNGVQDPAAGAGGDNGVSQQRAVVVETLWESFLISQCGQIPAGDGESDKENAGDGSDVYTGSVPRYVVALLANAGGTAGKRPPRSRDARQADTSVEQGGASGAQAVNCASSAADVHAVANGALAKPSAADELVASPVSVPDSHQDASEEATPAPSKASDESTEDANGPIQILHRNLGEENFEFLADGIHVLSSEVANGKRKGWKLEAQQWKWVQVGVSG